jgi:hypothetical protein
MNASRRLTGLGSQAVIGDLAQSTRLILRKSLLPLACVLAGETAYLIESGSPAAVAFALISVGGFIVLSVWRTSGLGLPVVPVLAVQHLVAYGLPIVTHNETLRIYRTDEFDASGWEVLCFCVSLAAAWKVGMRAFNPARAVSYSLVEYGGESSAKLNRLGFALAGSATVYLIAKSSNGLDFIYTYLPAGAASLISTLISAVSTSGFFLLAMGIGSMTLNRIGQATFWALLAINCAINASSFLLSSTITLFSSVLLGLFWTTGRLPWRYTLVVLTLLGFLSAGKYTMREHYWRVVEDGVESIPAFTPAEMVDVYGEWAAASAEAVTSGREPGRAEAEQTDNNTGRGLLGRINNLQNLLFVIHAMQTRHIPPLHGETYARVPEVLIPRILWPGKPRSHIGQEILNVHFDRQDLISTYSTYIAWGLLPEAYGNFGPILGAFLLGLVLGVTFAWVENFTAQKLVISLEGFLAFALMLAMVNSFEMVSTVLVPSIEESLAPIGLATLPFVRRTARDREPRRAP